MESSVAAIEAEIRSEKGSRLGATGEELEKRIARMRAVREAYVRAPESERPALRAQHEALRAEASQLRWNLIVQREAMGLTRHQDVYSVYPVPDRLD